MPGDPSGEVDLGPLKLKLPRLIVWAMSFVALFVVMAYSYKNHIDPVLHPDTVNVDKDYAVQQEESMKHISETASSEVLIDGAIVRFYASDACIAVMRPLGAGFRPHFILDPLSGFTPMGRLGAMEVSGAGLFLAGKRCERKHCLNPHPGVPYEERAPVDLCTIDIYREWEDGCAHIQTYDICADESIRTRDLCCVHSPNEKGSYPIDQPRKD
jgi:hypothetical protein